MAGANFEFDGVVRVTRLGIAYLLFTLFLGFAALNTGSNSLYIALSLMLGTLIVSGVLSQRGLQNLHAEFASADTPWAGATVQGRILLRNRSRWLSPRDVVLVTPDLEAPVLVDEVRRRDDQIIPVAFRFERRGRMHLERIDLYCRYPFGLFLKKRRVPIEGELIVYPRLLVGKDVGSRDVHMAGATIEENRAGRGNDIFGFREYSPGDSLRHVHWKKSARLGRWILRQPQAEADGALHVAVDPYVRFSADDAKLEQQISAAATVAWQALSEGRGVTLHLPGGTWNSGQSGMRGLMEALALLQAEREPVVLLVPPGTLVFRVRSGERDGAQVA